MGSNIPWPALDEMCEIVAECPPGAFVEVGVYQGGSAERLQAICNRQGRALYLYDTFQGIPYSDPEKGDTHRVGDFSDTSLEKVKALLPDAIITKGIFPGSAIEMPPISFVHLDCDQYQSVRDAIVHLWPLMVPGAIMLFDDFNCLQGATRAVRDCFGEENYKLTKFGKAYVVKGEHDLAA